VDALERLRAAILDAAAKDIRLNLQAVQRLLPLPPHGGQAGLRREGGRARMNRIMQPATNWADFELKALAVSAINGCEMCVRTRRR
jgi:alkylhydroperoxidase family enzyme